MILPEGVSFHTFVSNPRRQTNDPFSELPSGHFFRWLSLNRWRAIVDQKQSGNTLGRVEKVRMLAT
jgi:hypothetical protein